MPKYLYFDFHGRQMRAVVAPQSGDVMRLVMRLVIEEQETDSLGGVSWQRRRISPQDALMCIIKQHGQGTE